MIDKKICAYQVFYAHGGKVEEGGVTLDQKPALFHVEARLIIRAVIGRDNHPERVTVYWEGRYREMYVDETGVLKGLPRNKRATTVYRNNVMEHEPGQHRLEDLPWVCGDAVLFDRRISLIGDPRGDQ